MAGINLAPHPDGCTFRVETIGGQPFRATCETHNAPAVRDVSDTHWICGYAQNDEFADAYRLEGADESTKQPDPLPDDWPTELTDRVLRILDIAGSTGCLTWGQRKECRSVAAALREGRKR